MKRITKTISSMIIISMLTVITFPIVSVYGFMDSVDSQNQRNEQIENDFISDTNEGSQQTADNPNEEEIPEEPDGSDGPGGDDPEDPGKPGDPGEPEGPLDEFSEIPVLSIEMKMAANAQQAATEDDLKKLVSEVPANDELYEIEVIKDIHLTSSVVIQDQQNIKIYSDGTANITADAARHFEVTGILTLSDIILDGKDASGGIIVNGGSLIVDAGATITNCFTLASGAGIFAENGLVEINGGTIMSNTSGQGGGGIFATGGSDVILNEGSIRENSLIGTGNGGAGIVIDDENSSLTMYDGEIADNQTSLSSNASTGGGIFLKGTFNMFDGTISGNESTAYGGGVSINASGVMHMHGGRINNNIVHKLQTPNSITPCGGGIFVGSGGRLTVDGGIIEYNTSDYGGGVYVGYPDPKETVFRFNGGTIRANTANAYGGGIMAQYSNSTVNIDGGIVGGEEPEDANFAANGGGLFIMQGTVNMDSGEIIGNEASATGGGIYNYGGQLHLNSGAIAANSAPQAGGVMVVGINSDNLAVFKMAAGEITNNQATDKEGGGILLYSNVDAELSGGEIKENHAKMSGGGIHVVAGTILPISKAQITGNTAGGSGGGVYVTGSSINMASGSIQNNQAAGAGGGIFATTDSTLNISGGNISGNQSSSYGGGIYLTDDSNATMTGGTIGGAKGEEGNQCSTYGGGVYVHSNSNFVLDGGSIEGNRIKLSYGGGGGGGVYVYAGSSFELKSGAIKNNISSGDSSKPSYGGGIMIGAMSYTIPPGPLSACTLTMSGGLIEGNTSGAYGGGVAIVGNGEFSMTGGSIRGNAADERYGGGVYIGDPFPDTTILFTMGGGDISNNTAVAGGGVMMASKNPDGYIVQFDMDGGLISGNRSTVYYGGGVCAVNKNSIFNMGKNWNNSQSMPSIEGNTAKTNGGGICLVSAQLHIDKGAIKENQAGEPGGGLYLLADTELQIKNAQISGNRTDKAGGGAFLAVSTILQMENVEISGNIAGENGGGVYVTENSQLTATEKISFTGNQAGTEGGAVYSDKFDVYDAGMKTASDYSNLSFGSDTIFDENLANALYYPPNNASSFLNIGFAKNSFSNLVGHPLNNYDINFVLEPAVTLYSITYHANDETSTPKTVTYIVAPGSSHTIKAASDPEIAFTRSDYVFTGWNSLANGQGTDYKDRIVLDDINQNITLYAQWKKDVTYTITYDANGGQGHYMDSDLRQGDSYTVKAASETGITNPARPFVSWNTQRDGKGTTYGPGDTVTIEEDVTLYAQWGTPGSGVSCTVTYDANGGKGSHQDSGLLSGTPYTVKTQSETGITYSGHTFTGWNTQQNGKGTAYASQDMFSISHSMTLYAQWKKDSGSGSGPRPGSTTYTVTYDANGGEGSHKDTGLSAGTTYTVRTQSATGITHEGNRFTGWNTKRDGSGTGYDAADVFTITGNVTIYAQWQLAEKTLLNKEDHLAYIVGYPDRTVRPNENITRAETATVFFRLLTEEARNEYWSRTNGYYDVAGSEWFHTAVSTMSNANIITGYEDGSFGGNRSITRAEFAVIAARFDNGSYTGPDKFSDIGSHWAKEYINRAVENGWLTGYEDGTFKPDQYITRAEAMTLVNRVLERDKIKDTHLYMVTWTDNLSTAWYYMAVQEATNSHAYVRDSSSYETWTEVLPNPDWKALESD